MSWRIGALAAFCIAAVGVIADALLRGIGATGVSPTTVTEAANWFLNSQTPVSAGVGHSQSVDAVWHRGIANFARFPVWFLVSGLGLLVLWLAPENSGRSDTATAQHQQFPRSAKLALSALLIMSLQVVFVDATPQFSANSAIISSTLGDIWRQSDPQGLLWLSSGVREFTASQGGGWSLDWVVRLPIWALLVAAALAVVWIAEPRTNETSTANTQPDQSRGADPADVDDDAAAPTGLIYSCKSAILSAGLFSALVNVLMLTGALFMLEVYDRVLPSRSVPTLVALDLIVVFLFAAQIILDIVRNRLLVRIGNVFQKSISNQVFDAQVRLPLLGRAGDHQREPIHELDTIRSFLASPGPVVLFDLPWLPIYLAVVFALHPWLGWTACAGALMLIALTAMTDIATRAPSRRAAKASGRRGRLIGEAKRNAEALVAMGMLPRAAERWDHADSRFLVQQSQISDVTGGFGSIAKGLRLILQAGVLAVGAYLVILQEASAGVIIASAILANRALSPLDQAIGQWRNFVAARQSWSRLKTVLRAQADEAPPMVLPAPRLSLKLDELSATAPGGRELIIKSVSFELSSGQGLGLVGPSGSGKSSIARLLVGAWQPLRGTIMLDGASLNQWSLTDRGRHIGYVPQTVELMEGTIAENIARFSARADADAIMAAAQSAGVHELILTLPQGYESKVGERGEALSVGQRQRIALARALYGDPFLVVMDEPNSNLDAEGDAALSQAIRQIRERGGIVVVVAHRRSALVGVDTLLTLNKGQVVAYGEKETVIAEFRREFKNVPRHLQAPDKEAAVAGKGR